jgi:hypothetical protein
VDCGTDTQCFIEKDPVLIVEHIICAQHKRARTMVAEQMPRIPKAQTVEAGIAVDHHI